MNIPKIIHQIWIGPNKKPEIWMKTFSNDYIKSNPEWKYMLWDDNNILELFDDFPLMLKIYDIEPTYNGKSDLLRYLILYKYGGIYIDADMVWLNNKSFDNILNQVNESNFFIPYNNKNKDTLCGAIMASSIKNVCIKKLIDSVENKVKRPWKDNKIYLIDYKRESRNQGAWKRIGPGLLTRLYKNNKDITIFPSIYFYPEYWGKNVSIDYHETNNFPKESYTYQYGYTTNGMQKKINNMKEKNNNIKVTGNKFVEKKNK